MTKKDLERRYKFLLLQMKLISADLKDYWRKTGDERAEIISHMEHISDFENILEKIQFIEENDLNYNFYNKYMKVDSGEGGSL